MKTPQIIKNATIQVLKLWTASYRGTQAYLKAKSSRLKTVTLKDFHPIQLFKLFLNHRKKLYLVIALLILFIPLSNCYITHSTRDKIFIDHQKTPSHEIALVLGCSPHSQSFASRLDKAAQLYNSQKIRHFLVSGDNSRDDYNEPEAMRLALIKRGVPRRNITLDYAGFRTLDSIIRANEIFGLEKFLIITSDYHMARAIFIGQRLDLDVIGAPSPCSQSPYFSKINTQRERLARALAVIDTCFINRKARFLGPYEPIKLP